MMRPFLVALACLVAVVGGELAHARRVGHSNSHEWSLFKRQHNKSYASLEEEARRFANFMATKARVERHNADQTHPFRMGLNHLADWSSDELAKLNGLNVSREHLVSELPAEHQAYLDAILGDDDDDEELPAEVDWRKVDGRVSAVKNQGHCGSCWAFSTTGLLEGQQLAQKLTKELVPLSEQDLVDCSKQDNGCDGGLMTLALKDIKKMGGIMSEKDYPYRASEQACHYNKSRSVMSNAGAIVLPGDDEKQLKKVVAKYGPVAVALFASQFLQSYESGVLVDDSCVSGAMNHAVLIVGYGTDPEHGDFWIVKNSWSEHWGEQGYFRIQRGTDMCSIAAMPTIAKF